MPGMSAPALSEIQRRLSTTGKPATPQMPRPAQQAPVMPESETEDAQEGLAGHLSGSGLETADEDPEYDHSSEYEREDQQADLYTATSIKSGYLHKKGERRRAWKKRFFVLRPRSLGYYKDSKEYKLLRQIPLLDIRTCAQVQVKKHDYVFGIVTKERTFYIQTSSTHERDEWVQAINAAMDQAKRLEQGHHQSSNTDDADTPQARPSPGLTPQRSSSALSQSGAGTTQPIAIAGARPAPSSSAQPQSMASITTASSFSPSTLGSRVVAGDIPSSYTSQPSVGTQASSFGGPAPPPNSYAFSPAEPLQSYDLTNVDATLQQIQNDHVPPEMPVDNRGRQYSYSSASDAHNVPASSSFASSAAGFNLRPQSPAAAVSSSEDEDDEGEVPSTPISSSFHDPDGPSAQFIRRPSYDASAQTKLKAQPGPTPKYHPEHDKTILAGYLTKQGKRKNWRKRWFSLSSSSLSYSRSHMDTKVHHQIPLERVLDVLEFEPPNARRNSKSSNDHSASAGVFTAADTSSKKYEHCFQIITPKRTLKLCATDEQSEAQWIQAIRQQLKANRQGSFSSQSGPVFSSPQSSRSVPARSPSQQHLKQTASQQQAADYPRQMSAPITSGTKPQLPSIQTRLEQPRAGPRSPPAHESFVSSPVSLQADSSVPLSRGTPSQRVSFQSVPLQPVRQSSQGTQRSSTQESGREMLDAANERFRQMSNPQTMGS